MKTTRYGATAPMPESLRHFMRAGHHPARSLPCPWCHARAHQPCTVRSNGRQPNQVHQQRMAEWARTTACCPTCQVTPTVPCHAGGRELTDGAVHARRYLEAEETAA
ncbi:hypothetical protein ACFVZJ_21235 [Streptomyces sp. NPDC058322]|uniref:zinc finger domain-containing protein n=1 Tax=Streptomyces sp. NPDC058322 TaxID=3346446 RepID=UPI0036ED8D1E